MSAPRIATCSGDRDEWLGVNADLGGPGMALAGWTNSLGAMFPSWDRQAAVDVERTIRLVDGVGIGMAAVGLVLLGVWAIGRQGEREAQLPYRTTRLMRRLGLVSISIGVGMIVIAVVALIGGEPGRSAFYVVFGVIEIIAGRESRRGEVIA